MLYGLILAIHIVACFILVAVILLQAGRGGGFSEAFGGAAQTIFGTRGATYLTRATTLFAVVFMLTSLSLAFLSAQQGRSLLERAPDQGLPSPAKAGATTEGRGPAPDRDRGQAPAQAVQTEAPGAGQEQTSPPAEPEKTAPPEASPAGETPAQPP